MPAMRTSPDPVLQKINEKIDYGVIVNTLNSEQSWLINDKAKKQKK